MNAKGICGEDQTIFELNKHTFSKTVLRTYSVSRLWLSKDELKEEGGVCLPMADSCCCMAETNTIL